MAICTECNQEMKDHVGCTLVRFDDQDVDRLRHGDQWERWKHPLATPYGESAFCPVDPDITHCHDCNAPLGALHHPGCDTERCPKCHWQTIACWCPREDEDEEDE